MAKKKKHSAAKTAAEKAEKPDLTKSEALSENKPAETDLPEPDITDPESDLSEPDITDPETDLSEPDITDPETDLTEPEPDDATASSEPPADEQADAEGDEPEEPQFTLQTLIANTKGVLERFSLPDLLMPRFMVLYFLISGISVLLVKHSFNYRAVANWREYVNSIIENGAIPKMLIALVIGFVLLSLLSGVMPKKWKITDQTLGIASILFFDCTMLWRVNDFFMTSAVAFVSLVFIYYLINKLPSREPYEKVPWGVCGLICLGATVFVTYFIICGTVAKHKAFGTACHDFGLFAQMFHYLSNGLEPLTTAERDTLVSHFHVHASYIFYLIVPFYRLFKTETVLLYAQGILAMGGAIPMFLIAKRRNFKGISLIFITFTYIFSIALISPCFYDFHENAFLPTLLMWLLYAVDISNPILTWIMTVLVCIVKEDAPLYIICIGLFVFFEKKETQMRLQGLLMAIFSGIYMMLITRWLTANGDGSMMTDIRFGLLLINHENGLGEVIRNVLLDPAYFFSLLIHEDTLKFFLEIMLPLLFLPFMTKKLHRFWLMVPMIIMNMVVGAGYGYASNIDFHYIFGPVCLLFYMVFLNLEDLGEKPKHDLAILLGSAAILFFVGLPLHYWDHVETYESVEKQFQMVEDTLDTIPRDASVNATPFFIPHISERDELYLFDMSDIDEATQTIKNMDFDFFVFGPNTELCDITKPLLEQYGWTVFDEVPNRVLIYQNPNYQGA